MTQHRSRTLVIVGISTAVALAFLFSPVTLFRSLRDQIGKLYSPTQQTHHESYSTSKIGRMNHLVLLGDSIFDNGVYVRSGGPSVIKQLQSKVEPLGWKATLLARDGDIVQGIPRQLNKLPSNATHLFISVGGNNALGYMSILSANVSSVGEALIRLNQVRKKFSQDYSSMLEEVLQKKLPTTVCTVYNPRYNEVAPQQQEMCEAGICLLNDIIIAEAEKHGLPVIDLKAICNEASDYANPIEPDAPGGDKITNNILDVMKLHDFSRPITSVFAKTTRVSK